MKNIIATWICIDQEEQSTWFPSAKGQSSDAKVQEIYWRCVTCFFAIARYFNPRAELVLFSTVDTLPRIGSIPLADLLKKWEVRFYTIPFEFIPPKGYSDQWRNQFYEFSIFKFISGSAAFADEDRFLLLDSDCITHADLSELFCSVEEHSCITYIIDYSPEHVINGNSRRDMQSIFAELSGCATGACPPYHAGEFYASTIRLIRSLMPDFYFTWKQLLNRHAAEQPVLHEEAHVLSYLFHRKGLPGGQANRYIKRLWTDPTSFRNVEKADASLPIWHLPAEKRFGFRRLWKWLQGRDFDLSGETPELLNRLLGSLFSIPAIPLRRKPYYAAKILVKKILSFS